MLFISIFSVPSLLLMFWLQYLYFDTIYSTHTLIYQCHSHFCFVCTFIYFQMSHISSNVPIHHMAKWSLLYSIRAGRLHLMGQIWSCTGTIIPTCLHTVYISFTMNYRSWGVAAEIIWLTKWKLFPVWPLMEKICYLWCSKFFKKGWWVQKSQVLVCWKLI